MGVFQMIAQGFRIYRTFIVCAEVNPAKDKTSFNYYIKNLVITFAWCIYKKL